MEKQMVILPARPIHMTLLAGALLGCGPQGPRQSEAAAAADSAALAASARTFLSALNDGQRDDASFAFGDPERTNWGYVPRSRKGLALKEMNSEQRSRAFGLLGTGLSERGTQLAHGVIELEGILREQEGRLMSIVGPNRDPGLYFVSLFTGSDGAYPWGWRFEGHHLSVNVTDLGPRGQIVAPVFVGANPARVPSGPRAGFRLLAAEEDVAFELLRLLDAQQRSRTTISAQTFGDIVTGTDPTAKPTSFAGLPAADMTPAQQQLLRRLIGVYAGRMADSAASGQLRRIDEAGFERLHFAWAGAHEPGQPHYYRIHGPTVLVEYDNSQGSANHIHTVWRDLENDFGGDLLRNHYAQQVHRE
jgi:hypothetical protein